MFCLSQKCWHQLTGAAVKCKLEGDLVSDDSSVTCHGSNDDTRDKKFWAKMSLFAVVSSSPCWDSKISSGILDQ